MCVTLHIAYYVNAQFYQPLTLPQQNDGGRDSKINTFDTSNEVAPGASARPASLTTGVLKDWVTPVAVPQLWTWRLLCD